VSVVLLFAVRSRLVAVQLDTMAAERERLTARRLLDSKLAAGADRPGA
jgi:hypothetical protein